MTTAAQLSDDLAALVAAHSGSVVRLETHGCRGASAVAWTGDVVVTAAHLVDGDTGIGLPDGTTVQGKLIGRDEGTDIAALRIDAALTPAPFADLDPPAAGHLTLSLARPGKSVRASLGMIGTFGEGLRTGAPPGFRGSLLLDVRGRALGINTHGIAVPTATVRRVVAELVAHGRIRRGYLGVGVAPVRLQQRGAVVIVAIEPGGPAERGGLLVGDVILSIEGTTIGGPRDLSIFLADKIDRPLKVEVQRAGNPVTLTVTSGTRA